jgi:glutamate-ammonia-ligase adenylyltransferase
MTATSDLDLILIYGFDPAHPESDGARPLHGAQYYARLTQRLVNALTTQTNYGRLYNVDMRLRPSGRSGPVAQAIRDVLSAERDKDSLAGDVVEMRRAIAAEKGDGSRWDLKHAAGGLVDLEFIAQYLQLAHAAAHPEILDTSTARALEKAAGVGLLSVDDAEALRPAARLYHDLTQILRLCLPGDFNPETAGRGLLGLLARAADVPDFGTLEAHLADTQERVRKSFIRILGAAP